MGSELGLAVGNMEVATFADGETRICVHEDVRDAVVVIVQPTAPPVNDHLMSLALVADAVVAAGARRVVAVVPYFGYARQERRAALGEPRSAMLAGRLLGTAGIDHLVTLDLHDPALESAFPMPATLLESVGLFVPVIRSWDDAELVVVAPDAGAMKRAQQLARALDVQVAVVVKQREAPDAPIARRVVGDVRGRRCVIVDDMASTGRTLAEAGARLVEAGAQSVDAVFTHPVLAEGALDRLTAAPLARLVTSDSIPVGADVSRAARVVPVAPLLAGAVREVTGRTG
jgi:ribose-phosphate pyrophosphokinase